MEIEPDQTAGVRFWRRSNNDPVKIVAMAVLVSFTCALLVSTTELLLMPKRMANINAQRDEQMASMLAVLPGFESLLRESGADSLQTRIVDLTTGHIATEIDVDKFDPIAAAADPLTNMVLPADIDIAGLGQRANYATVYMLYRGDELQLLILPVRGMGYQSMIRAWLALAGDLNTVQALSIYEQGETPGLGTRIEEPDWLAQFTGKQLHDENGKLILKVVKGKSSSDYEVDGISGATRTGNGINNMLSFWLSDAGFGLFLASLADDQGL